MEKLDKREKEEFRRKTYLGKKKWEVRFILRRRKRSKGRRKKNPKDRSWH